MVYTTACNKYRKVHISSKLLRSICISLGVCVDELPSQLSPLLGALRLRSLALLHEQLPDAHLRLAGLLALLRGASHPVVCIPDQASNGSRLLRRHSQH